MNIFIIIIHFKDAGYFLFREKESNQRKSKTGGDYTKFVCFLGQRTPVPTELNEN